MATVISAVRTAEGFVIGSDGRKSTSDDPPKILSDDTQKIFPLVRSGLRLAYGLFGTIRMGESADDVTFDFEPAIVRAAENVGRRSTWPKYLAALAITLDKSLSAARSAKNLPFAKPDGTIIAIGGYFGTSQVCGHIRFEHEMNATKIEHHNYQPGFSFPWGHPKVLGLVDGGDVRFATYADPPRHEIVTLAGGIKRVRNDILAHYDPEAFKVDEGLRWRVGGRVQIVTVTSSDGFQWVPGFEPVRR